MKWIKHDELMDNFEGRQEKIEKVVDNRQEGIIVLEDIHDPHNAAAVWRSADCFGFQKVYIICEQEQQFDPKQLGKESSSSANKWLDFKIFKSTEACINLLKNDGYKVYATVLNNQAKEIYKTNFKEHKIAILLGNEHRGLSQKAMEMSDAQVYIPMKGMVQSLNLSVTASILMYEISRQRLGKKFSLDKTEKDKIKKQWRFY